MQMRDGILQMFGVLHIQTANPHMYECIYDGEAGQPAISWEFHTG